MKVITFFLCLFPATMCFSQNRQRLKEQSFNPSSFKEFKIELKTDKKDKQTELHYGSAFFLDGRADTSKLGFVLTGENMSYHRFVFPKPAAKYLAEKSTPFFAGNNSSNGKIVFVLKHLWVAQQIIKADFLKSVVAGPMDYLSFCYVNADCYSLENGHFRLLGNIDSVISMQRWIVHFADDLLKKTLIHLLRTGDSLFVSNAIKASDNAGMTYEELTKKIHDDFDRPVLKSSQPKPGVFLTYADFLNNAPATNQFKITKDKDIELLQSPDITDEIINKAWGYYDGNDLNIHINEGYYRMVRSQNTFEVAGPRQLTRLYGTKDVLINASVATFLGGVLGGGVRLMFMGSDNKIMKELVPYQLNIRDGALY